MSEPQRRPAREKVLFVPVALEKDSEGDRLFVPIPLEFESWLLLEDYLKEPAKANERPFP